MYRPAISLASAGLVSLVGVACGTMLTDLETPPIMQQDLPFEPAGRSSSAQSSTSGVVEVASVPSSGGADPPPPSEAEGSDTTAIASKNDRAGKSAKEPAAGPRDHKRLRACCEEIARSAKSAPPSQVPFLLQALSSCRAAASTGNPQLVKVVRAAAGLPSLCK